MGAGAKAGASTFSALILRCEPRERRASKDDRTLLAAEDVDGRHKAGHDENELSSRAALSFETGATRPPRDEGGKNIRLPHALLHHVKHPIRAAAVAVIGMAHALRFGRDRRHGADAGDAAAAAGDSGVGAGRHGRRGLRH